MSIGTPPPPLEYDPPLDPYLTVLHYDEDILIVNKQAELLSVPGRSDEHYDCIEYRAHKEFPSATIVHRLDCSTSGIMVLALNPEAHKNLSLQFEKRRTNKVYTALVWGHVTDQTGLIDLPLICDWPNRPKQMVCYERGRPSQTKWEVDKHIELEKYMLCFVVPGHET